MKKRSPEVQRLRRPGTRRLRLSHSVAKPKRQKSTCLQHLKRQLSTGLRLRESPNGAAFCRNTHSKSRSCVGDLRYNATYLLLGKRRGRCSHRPAAFVANPHPAISAFRKDGGEIPERCLNAFIAATVNTQTQA